jgi:hypothetical protein
LVSYLTSTGYKLAYVSHHTKNVHIRSGFEI